MSFFDDADLDAKAAQDQEEQNSADWTPEDGESLQAIVLSRKVVNTKYGKKLVLVVRNVGEDTSGEIEAGKSGNLWCSTVLARKVLEAQPMIGKGISVRYEGKVQPEKGGNAYKDHTLIVEASDPAAWVGVAEQLDDNRTQTPRAAAVGESDWKF